MAWKENAKSLETLVDSIQFMILAIPDYKCLGIERMKGKHAYRLFIKEDR